MPDDLLAAARRAWDDALELGEVSGFRNAQATVLAPTGTISFMMDCDTTGVEPDFSLVKSKKLVGGGEITIVNKTVPMALAKLGYAPTEGDEIVAFIDERNTIVGAPYVKTEHYPVFDCAIGDRAIHYMGHVKMMGAVQPFISGAISKTVNLPEEITVDEISQLFIESWQLGVKAIAIYRDNCKVAQPLSGKANAGATTLAPVSGVVGALPQRRRLPDDRVEVGRKFKVGEYEGYIHVGLFDDGTPGDIFVDIAKEGTTLAGLMNSFMISVSLGLQYGVPLEVYVSKFSHMRFEPSGMTNDADIRIAKSIVDYIFRWMGKKFLSTDQQEEAGILTAEVKQRLAAAYTEAGDHASAAETMGVTVAPGPGPDGALQPVGGRAGVRPLRRPHGADGQLLHLPRLRDQHRLLVAFSRRTRQAPRDRGALVISGIGSENRPMRDDDVRSSCFAALDVLQAKWGADIPYAALREGFNFRGRRVPFLSRGFGIYRSREAQRGPAALVREQLVQAGPLPR